LAGDPADENQLHGLESEISVPMGTDVNDEQGDGEEEEVSLEFRVNYMLSLTLKTIETGLTGRSQ
jgi:hypothetical protein